MQITNTNLTQSFNAIFRNGQIYAEAQIKVLVQRQGTVTVKEFTPALINYYPNYCKITINLTDIEGAYEWKDGEEYMIKVINNYGSLIYMDTMLVRDNSASADYKTNEDNMTAEEVVEEREDNDYIILDN